MLFKTDYESVFLYLLYLKLCFSLLFFGLFFYVSLAPSIFLGCVWPPEGIEPFTYTGVPLLNTLLLLTSGAAITAAHYGLLANRSFFVIEGFIFTFVCAFVFTGCQFYEYINAPFAISDGVFGSVFYMITGLHGAHVIIGTLFLLVCFFRFLSQHYDANQHVGFECAVWYWHFVDVVWLFVFCWLYVWSQPSFDYPLLPSELLELEEENSLEL
jgi:heme/copper-type cytochrome/quinol oxidase subunit 3